MGRCKDDRAAVAGVTWKVEPAHSTVAFSVKRMGIANMRGKVH
jgi:polyisoprenoid-binding protein YceI